MIEHKPIDAMALVVGGLHDDDDDDEASMLLSHTLSFVVR